MISSLNNLNDGGGIAHVFTGLTRFVTPGFATYASMKGAVETLAKYQAQELGVRKIRVNTIAPGQPHTTQCGVVAFLCTDDAKWINAQRIEVPGGSNL